MMRIVHYNGAAYLVGRYRPEMRQAGYATRTVELYQGTQATPGTWPASKVVRYYA